MGKHTKKVKIKYKILLVIFVIIFIICIGTLLYMSKDSNSNKAIYEEIKEETKIENSTGIESNITENMYKIAQVKGINTDIVGWIQIDNTQIDYPILQQSDNEYYLTHNYKKEKSKYGSIYLKNSCNMQDINSNLIIYGHNMKDGQMFNNILKYEDKIFYNEHKTIKIATEQEENTYSIVAVFKSRIFYQDEQNVFRFYNYTNFENENKYNEFINNCKKIQLYDTGVSAQYGEQLITLITCEYSQENGRMVIVAKKES